MSVERRVLLAMCVLISINQLGFGSVIPVLPLYAQSFGVQASAIGMAVAIAVAITVAYDVEFTTA